MANIIYIVVMLAKRKMITDVAEKVGITMANISVLKNSKAL